MRIATIYGLALVCSVAAQILGCAQAEPRMGIPSDSLTMARRDLEARYIENGAAFFARDVDRVMRLRHPNFHTVTPDGTVSSREQMYERTRSFAADPLILVGLALWLQSNVAALGAVVPIALMVMRLRLEEHFLRRELPGYTAYAARVRFRLIPGIW